MEGSVSTHRHQATPFHEYLLQGSVVDSSCEVLLNRLRGLCDNAENNYETFHDHELVFAMRGTSNQNSQAVFYRVRHSLTAANAPWHLRYIGQAEVGDKTRHTLVRTYVDVGTSDNVVAFLNEMGFRLDYEYVIKGYFFHKGRMKVTVSKIFRMLQPNNVESIEPLSLSYLVELSVVAPAGQELLQDDMKNFAEQLKPLVQLEKIDHRRITMM
ncbi:mediator of RNA polymerase II transcription subunit 18 [Octopus bimaculoides]|uniref:Mediator of RNA polymerase II transcription subunit 18 n=1 Tax=Octopus bimaculoides TaxID=37653 RepID=A0A0L8FI45_OCTBM|nr:mediator of RNA polymerase II transcription subunit 18 [Octopus bimaculoides]|eukprot:XP_014789612.1 PREDICTED: mediator of RNA polymerase II transcription subunit 18-like [Octopus bimaculoides]